MSAVRRLLTTRWSAPGPISAFEGPFGADKRVAIAEDEVAARLAGIRRVLVAAGIGEGDRIGVLSNHRVETYLAVLGAVSAGATFVPLNPKFPAERLRTIVDLARPTVILGDPSTFAVHGEVAAAIPFRDVSSIDADPDAVGEWGEAIDASATGTDAIAYIMFTSGSTGTPKGVPISYGNLLSYVDGVTDLLAIPEGSRFSQFFDLSFDLSMHDIFVSTRMRGTLVAPSQVDLMMPGAYVARERIDAWFSVPLLGAQLGGGALKSGFAGFRSMLFCGEALPMETVVACRPWLADGGRMWNLYGPTEATIAFTAADVTDSARVEGNASIGRAFGGNVTALLGADGVVVEDPPLGAEGELLLGGPQVFAGYSTDAPSPFVVGASGDFYKSGDLVRIDPDGVYFRGRVDSQVKFRGYRIELGEIETVARRTFGLKTLAVVVSGEGATARMVMFYLASELGPRTDGGDTTIDLRGLAETLPAYMIPAEAVGLDHMPTNQNGKIDRRALRAVAESD
jgi:D-alanine--poly(phosphoribitol) ligase subunit 1